MHKRKNKIEYEKTTIAIAQILILVIATIAFSWMVGGGIGMASADDACAGTCVANQNLCSTGTIVSGCTPPEVCCVNSGVADTCAIRGGNCVGQNLCGTGTVVTPLTRCTGTDVCCIDNAVDDKSNGEKGSVGDTLLSTGSTIITTKNTIDAAKEGLGAIKNIGAKKFSSTYTKAYIKALEESGGDTAYATYTAEAADAAIVGKWAGGGLLLGGDTGVGALGAMGIGGYGAIVVWSAVAFLVGRYVGPMLGLNTQQSQALGYSLAAGTAAGLIALEIIGASASGGPIGIAVGVVVAFVMFSILAKKSSMDVIQYTCSQWDSQSGRGLTEAQKIERCKMCNNQKDLVCTEYQCRSLGQGCALVNEESSGKQLCIWNNTRDINPPIMTPWEEALLDDFKYTPDNTVSPPDKGVKISYTGTESVTMDGATRCAPAFTPISFGVKLDEPAKCKINPLKLSSYGEMADVFMGRGIRDYNQSFVLTLPSKEAMEAENITVENGGKYELYVRCEDANGNANIGNFVFKFCISQGPDTTSPLILGSSILDKQPIAFGQKSVGIDLYVRDQTFTKENASCRWSHLDKSYSTMEENMSCTHSLLNINSQLIYSCSASLTGLKDNQDNKFYFRCADDLGNANRESYSLTLIGTKPLVIESVGPKGIIEDSTNVIKINLTAQTAAGHDEGKAICSFSETGSSGSYVDFFYGYDAEPFSQYRHSQELWLEEGNYTYFIQCRDEGGNIDNKNVSFGIETDLSSPVVVRVYKEDDYLKLITDEPGKCVYFPNGGCTYLFDEGTLMTSLEEKEYYAEWNIKNDLYIKCKDEYGNMPSPDECSIIARPFEIFELQWLLNKIEKYN